MSEMTSRPVNWYLRAAVVILLASAGFVAESRPGLADQPGNFDYYVLSLSWSPTYCQTSGRNAAPLQCRASKPHRFIVHGLWPQYERGWPDYCPADRRAPDRTVVDNMLDIMPSRSLIGHQWTKHGTCSGLDPEAYFDLTRAAFTRVTIPPALRTLERPSQANPDSVEKAFRLANPGLRDNAVAVTCARGLLDEVRICFDRDLNFRSCRFVDRTGCKARNVKVPAPR